MAGEVTYQPTEADYIAAAKASFRAQIRGPRALRGWAIIAAALTGFAVYTAWRNPYWTEDPFGVVFLVIWGVFGPPLLAGISYLFVARRGQRRFRQQKTLRQPISWRWTSDGISYDRESAKGYQNWADLYGWAKRNATYLFFVNEQAALPLPERILSAEQIADLDKLLLMHVPRRR